MKKKKGFTLVELLAVIVVLAIILVIAVPKILDVIKSSRENSLISSVKLVARNAEQKKLTNEVLGESTTIICSEVADLSSNDYDSCSITFDEEGSAIVSITGKGKFSGYTCSGTKNDVTCEKSSNEGLVCNHYKYDGFKIKNNLTEEEKNDCVDIVMDAWLEYGSDNDWAEGYATAVCKHELIDSWAEEYEKFNDLLNDWNYNTYDEFISDNVDNDILDEVYTYEDVENFFERRAVGCSENYLSSDWAYISELKYNIGYGNENYNTKNIAFYDTSKVTGPDLTGLEGIDVSEAHDGGILLYKKVNSYDEYCLEYEDEDYCAEYDVYIVSNEKIYLPIDSSYLFFDFNIVEEIAFNNSIDTSNVTNMSGMFNGSSKLATLDVSNFNTSNVTDMSSMFGACDLEMLDLSSFDTSNVIDMSGMFNGNNYVKLDISSFDTSNVTDMSYMFSVCKFVTIGFDNSYDLNLGTQFNTSKVTDMSEMFYGCKSLTELDISKFSTSKVTNMSGMFRGCENLVELDLSNFDTSNVDDMYRMFYGCDSLTVLDISSFNTSKVTDMSYMFTSCLSLEELDISSFDTSNVTIMQWMFNGCENLQTIYVGNNWNVDAVTNDIAMFVGCTSLIGGAGTVYTYSKYSDYTTTIAYARVDGGTDNPGYLTLKA